MGDEFSHQVGGIACTSCQFDVLGLADYDASIFYDLSRLNEDVASVDMSYLSLLALEREGEREKEGEREREREGEEFFDK